VAKSEIPLEQNTHENFFQVFILQWVGLESDHLGLKTRKWEIFGFQISEREKVPGGGGRCFEVVRTGMGRSERKRGNAGGGAGGSCGWKAVWVGERDWRKTWFFCTFF